jgi:tetratricopeptide (TPR) repeat protein
MSKLISFLLLFATSIYMSSVMANSLDNSIHELQQQWAVANYETPENKQDEVFDQLTAKAESVVKAYPEDAEPLVWEAIIISSHAGATGGFGALGKAKKAKKLLEQAEKINPDALQGSIYTSLGSLYYNVPGWPIAFGNDEKAEALLKKALTMNPDGIDPNYFYGNFLLDQGRYSESMDYLQKALNAPPRPNRPLADKGRKIEIKRALQTVKEKIG